MAQSNREMPSIQGESVELFSRICPPPTVTSVSVAVGSTTRGSVGEENSTRSRILLGRPSTAASDRKQSPAGVGDDVPLVTSRSINPAKNEGEGDKRRPSPDKFDVNEDTSNLLGDILRRKLLAGMPTKDAAKEFVRRCFRYLYRGQGHVLSFEEFKEGLANSFGSLIPLSIIHATFDMFDTEPRTWQLDFDEFCLWLETGERKLNSQGISIQRNQESTAEPPKGRKPHSNDTSADFKASVKDDTTTGSMSLEQKDRATLKAHLMKHRNRLHKAKLTESQKGVVDLLLLEKIQKKVREGPGGEGSNALVAFRSFSSGSALEWPAFKKEVRQLVPFLRDESDIRGLFNRIDHNSDGVIDLSDFLMWVERMGEGKTNTDYWALEEEEHLQQLRLARSKAFNLLVPDDYDGSTYLAKLARAKAKARSQAGGSAALEEQKRKDMIEREKMENTLRQNILSKVKGGSFEMLRAFRHFRPAAAGRRLFLDFNEFRESFKQKGMGLSDEQIKQLFQYFDVDKSGEIDFSEFRSWLQGGNDKTGLEMGEDLHKQKATEARLRAAKLANAAVPKSKVQVESITGSQGNSQCKLSTGVGPEEDSDPEIITVARLHKELSKKIKAAVANDPRELLRAFRRVTRRKGSKVSFEDFMGALRSFGLSASNMIAQQLFRLYDWRDKGLVPFQEMVEAVVKGNSPPCPISRSERNARLEAENRIPEAEITRVETALREALWNCNQANAEECFVTHGGSRDGRMSLGGLRRAASEAGVGPEIASDQALTQIMSKYGRGGGAGERWCTWSLAQFLAFYQLPEYQKTHHGRKEAGNPDGQGYQKVTESSRARELLLSQCRHLAKTLRECDHDRSGNVSRTAFSAALANEGSLGKLGEAQLTSLLVRHGCMVKGGSYVNYPAFVRSFSSAVRAADPAAVTAATAVPALDLINPKTTSPALDLLPPRPSTGPNPGRGDGTSAKGVEQRPSKKEGRPSGIKTYQPRRVSSAASLRNNKPLGFSSTGNKNNNDVESQEKFSSIAGYSSKFPTNTDMARMALLQNSRSTPVLPNLVGLPSELPKTMPLHRAMKKDVVRSMKQLRRAFKQCESPYHRGIVSVSQFKDACRKHGVTIDNDDVSFLLCAHRHKVQARNPTGPVPCASLRKVGWDDVTMAGLRYDEFLRTCKAANDSSAPVH